MAAIEENSSERQINYELNIVPFIDLMSVCIIFLLLTAVWTQVSMIQIGSSVYGKRTDDQESKPPPRPEINLEVLVNHSGYIVEIGRNRISVPQITSMDGEMEHDQRSLILHLQDIKDKYPDKKDAMIAVDETLAYQDLIQGMDSLLLAGFPEVSIKTGSVQ